MTGSGRGALESLESGFLVAAANPVLLIPALASGVVTLIGIALSILALALPLGFAFFRRLSALRFSDRSDFLDLVSRLPEVLLDSPFLLIAALLFIALVALLVSLVLSFVNAGTAGVVVESHRVAAAFPSSLSFHRVQAWEIFLATGQKFVRRFFGLLNLYGLVLTFLVFLGVLSLAVLLFLGMRGSVLLGFLSLLATIPLLVAGAVSARLLNLAAARRIVAYDAALLDAVADAFSELRSAASQSLLLFVGTAGFSLMAAVCLALSHFLAAFVIGEAFRPGLVALSLVLWLAQGVVFAFLRIVTTGSFFALWSQETVSPNPGLPAPPRAFFREIAP